MATNEKIVLTGREEFIVEIEHDIFLLRDVFDITVDGLKSPEFRSMRLDSCLELIGVVIDRIEDRIATEQALQPLGTEG